MVILHIIKQLVVYAAIASVSLDLAHIDTSFHNGQERV